MGNKYVTIIDKKDFNPIKFPDVIDKDYGYKYNVNGGYPIYEHVFGKVYVLEELDYRHDDGTAVYQLYDEVEEEYEHLPEFLFKVPRGHKVVTCDCCGQKLQAMYGIRTHNGKYICGDCMEVDDYCTKNIAHKRNYTKTGLTYGFELECVPYDYSGFATFLESKYGFIPTEDSSLPSGGVEFKSPIFNSMRGIKSMFNVLSKCADFSYDQCGQHINIGHEDYDERAARIVQNNVKELFLPLNNAMLNNEEMTTKVCGRFFDGAYYGEIMEDDSLPCMGHSYFINVRNFDRIEFRISKFVDTKQYMELICMWSEIMQLIVEFCNNYRVWNRNYKFDAYCVGNKIADIFYKYGTGNAKCQLNNTFAK